MKKVVLVFNSLTAANGVARAAVAIANCLVETEQYDVTLFPLFCCEKEVVLSFLDKRVHVKRLFGFYFKGFAKLLDIIPDNILYRLIFRKQRYDVEVAFQFGLSTKIISASNNRSAIRLVWMHGYDVGLRLKDYYTKFDRVLCVSKCNAERLKEELNNSIIVDYCYNVIDDELVRELGKERIDYPHRNCFTFVSVGRMSQEKGYTRLIPVVERLANSGFVFSVWIVGDGPLKGELEEEIKNLHLSDFFVFLGTQRNPHKYTSKADVFICPSFSEGYSNACTEAIMLGVPVISTDVSGAREIIADSESGLVVDNSEDGIYEGMKEVLCNPSIVEEWKRKLVFTKERFSKIERTNHLLNIFDSKS